MGREVEAQVYTADGVTPTRFERDGNTMSNAEPITLAPGDFLTIGEAGLYTLRLRSGPPVESLDIEPMGWLDL